MYEILIREDLVFCLFYAMVTAECIIASCYLLFRRGNAFNPNVTPPVHLRRWTAAFLASMGFSHLWYLPTLYFESLDDIRNSLILGGLLDFMTVFPLAAIVLFSMLQDYRRQLWHVPVVTLPLITMTVWCLLAHDDAIITYIYGYILVLFVFLLIYMVLALRRYARWLRDNYADLEHKELGRSFSLLTATFAMLLFYVFGFKSVTYEYIVQLCCAILTFFLVWRVETLSDLSIPQSQLDFEEEEKLAAENLDEGGLPNVTYDNIGLLLQQYCIDTKLYLQHDLSLSQLAKTIGTNRSYLSQYFSHQGLTYNAYINNLRVNHFIDLFRESVASRRLITAQQLAHKSGYRSYSTFSLAFKQRMGVAVTTWMHDNGKE